MKVFRISILLFTEVVGACNLNLPQEKLFGKAKTPYSNQELDKYIGNTIAFHHIIPREDFENILYDTFNGLDFSKAPEAIAFFKQVAASITYPKLGVEFKNQELRNYTIEILNTLSTGEIHNRLIDGKGEGCLNKQEQTILHSYLSYLPSDGYFGPEPLLSDPGKNLDSYGKYFMDKNSYRAAQNLYANKALKNKLLNLELLNSITNYKISGFNMTLWGKVGNNKYACLIDYNTNECVER